MCSVNTGRTLLTERSDMNGILAGVCRNCAHFRNDRAYLEAAIPGLITMSSGDASVRAEDGIVCVMTATGRQDRVAAILQRCADAFRHMDDDAVRPVIACGPRQIATSCLR